MKGWRLSFCFAAVLVLAFAGRAEAACESQHRVAPANSNCLLASYTSHAWTAYNRCNHEIRVKVDVKGTGDTTRELAAQTHDDGDIPDVWGNYIRGVYCCSDYSSCN